MRKSQQIAKKCIKEARNSAKSRLASMRHDALRKGEIQDPASIFEIFELAEEMVLAGFERMEYFLEDYET